MLKEMENVVINLRRRGSVAQLRQLDWAACLICGSIRFRQGNRCNHCRADIATRETW